MTRSMINIRPLPDAAFEDVPSTPELSYYLSRCTDGTPVMIVWHGRIRRQDGRPVPVLVSGAAFGGRIYGEAAEVAGDLVVLAKAGMPEARTIDEPLLDLAVPARLAYEHVEACRAPGPLVV